MPESQAVDTIIAAHQLGAAVLVVPPVLDLHHDSRDVERVRGVPMVRMRPDPTMRFSWWAKRAVDTAVSALALLLLSPGLLLVALLVLLDSGRPILFWQQRVGLDGRPFDLCKFRSMRPVSVTESQTTWTVTDSTRISRIGRFLRASSLDEVPQLWNVLRGDMSLVGPRPERPSFVDRFSDEHERYWARHRVPVGLTGLAQVNGLRGDTSIADRARYDNYYIANWSPWLDVKIVLLTFREVLRGSGG
jgi:exopolysaccharide biosynthesis polyprenyl glycosylphosphotransferase